MCHLRCGSPCDQSAKVTPWYRLSIAWDAEINLFVVRTGSKFESRCMFSINLPGHGFVQLLALGTRRRRSGRRTHGVGVRYPSERRPCSTTWNPWVCSWASVSSPPGNDGSIRTRSQSAKMSNRFAPSRALEALLRCAMMA